MNELPKIARDRLKRSADGNHPDPNLLAAFAEQALPPRERASLLQHLAGCANCREVLTLSLPPLESSAGANKDTGTAAPVSWLQWPALRWGALAACVVIVGTAVLWHHEKPLAYVTQDVPVPAAAPASQRDEGVATGLRTGASLPTREQTEPARQVPAPQVRNEQLQVRNEQRNETKPQVPAPPKAMASTRSLRSGKEFAYAPGFDKDSHEWRAGSSGLVNGVARAAAAPAAPVATGRATPDLKDEAANLPGTGKNADQLTPLLPPTPNEASQTAQVQAEAGNVTNPLDGQPKIDMGRAKASPATDSTVLIETPGAAQFTPSPEQLAAMRKARAPMFRPEFTRWTISSDGHLQRSIDSGKSWQPVPVAENATFRALSANGPDLWVGGAAGLLYHSTDAGGHWTQVKPATDKTTLSADIAAIEFTDVQQGKITTASGEVWLTTDAGQTWQKRD
jgi:Photosynthesis system II assembly factor YCF48/Putative zinc-finger